MTPCVILGFLPVHAIPPFSARGLRPPPWGPPRGGFAPPEPPQEVTHALIRPYPPAHAHKTRSPPPRSRVLVYANLCRKALLGSHHNQKAGPIP